MTFGRSTPMSPPTRTASSTSTATTSTPRRINSSCSRMPPAQLVVPTGGHQRRWSLPRPCRQQQRHRRQRRVDLRHGHQHVVPAGQEVAGLRQRPPAAEQHHPAVVRRPLRRMGHLPARRSSGRSGCIPRETAVDATKRTDGAIVNDGSSTDPEISSDGRHIVFRSDGSHLVAGVNTTGSRVYVRHLDTSTTRLSPLQRVRTCPTSVRRSAAPVTR